MLSMGNPLPKSSYSCCSSYSCNAAAWELHQSSSAALRQLRNCHRAATQLHWGCLILEDLDCSIAHAKMLGKTKVLSSAEALQIINGLELIKVEYLEGKFSPSPPSEDIHYCIEEKLISLIGETGKKLHTYQDLRHHQTHLYV